MKLLWSDLIDAFTSVSAFICPRLYASAKVISFIKLFPADP